MELKNSQGCYSATIVFVVMLCKHACLDMIRYTNIFCCVTLFTVGFSSKMNTLRLHRFIVLSIKSEGNMFV
jgi:hypothetical protein